LLLLAVAILMAGCTYYETAPGVYATTPASTFDRSYAAARGAFEDQGLTITSEDRSAGVVHGSRNGINLIAKVGTQADGTVRVAFNTSGATTNDPELINRITRSYNRRMGR
jgi:hypothetical protein